MLYVYLSSVLLCFQLLR